MSDLFGNHIQFVGFPTRWLNYNKTKFKAYQDVGIQSDNVMELSVFLMNE